MSDENLPHGWEWNDPAELAGHVVASASHVDNDIVSVWVEHDGRLRIYDTETDSSAPIEVVAAVLARARRIAEEPSA